MIYNILIIDDNPKIAEDLIKVLQPKNNSNGNLDALEQKLFGTQDNTSPTKPSNNIEFKFTTAHQGLVGIELVAKSIKSQKHFALAFVDVRMPPGIDGIETIQKIWQLDSDIQIVLCTAYSDYSWQKMVDNLGLTDKLIILKKPFDSIAARQMTYSLTKKWQLERQSKQKTKSLENSIEQKNQSLQQANILLQSTLDLASEAIFVINQDNYVTNWNKKFERFFNVAEPLLKSSKLNRIEQLFNQQLKNPSTYYSFKEAHNQNSKTITKIHLKNGKIYECQCLPYFIDINNAGCFFSFLDITAPTLLQENLKYQATHDHLTGLPNRAFIQQKINQLINTESTPPKNKFALILFDIDRFKIVNDALGHEIGDKLLCAVSQRLSSHLKENALLARFGGDEFTIIMPHINSAEEVKQVAQLILSKLATLFVVDNQEIALTTSLGICLYPEDGQTEQALLKCADLAMFQAKKQGGNKIAFHKHELTELSMAQLKLTTDLYHAVEHQQFFLDYQPIIDIEKKHITSVEALIRWRHPKLGLISPVQFIPEAETSGLIIKIGFWVIREVAKQIIAWQKQGIANLPVAINLSEQQLQSPQFSQKVMAILSEFNVKPQHIIFEITENVILNQSQTHLIIDQLREHSFQVLLDDFGTSHSSLSWLKEVKVDGLKIDRSFINNIDSSASDAAIVNGIINMAQALNLKLVAEGVETKSQLQYLKENQCHQIQGFLFSKPISANKLLPFIQNLKKRL